MVITVSYCLTSFYQCHSNLYVLQTLPPAVAAHFVDVLDIDLAGCLCGVGPGCRSWMETSLSETAAKWVCNIISTGAHVRIGKVYGNLMVDVNVR